MDPTDPDHLDADADGIPNYLDRCLVESETVNGVDDDDGCPDFVKDTDGDGMLDTVDRCPTIREDIDGIGDDDGCPDAD